MKSFLLKTTAVLIVAFFATSFYSYAQPPVKAKERIEQLKKIKMLEILDLREDQVDKFLVKYVSYEKNIGEIRDKLMKNSDDMREAIAKKNSSDIKAKTEEHLKLIEEMHNAVVEKNKGLRALLDETQYAKFLIFEQKFMHELQKALIKRGDAPEHFEGKRRRK